MRKILALIFVFILGLPMAAWMIGLDFGIHVNKIGFEFPRPYGRALLDNAYYLSFDRYFNDSFSMRAPLIFAKNWLDYHVFRTTDAGDVYVGRNGWLYSRKSIDDYRKEACGEDREIEWMLLQLHALENMIEASGRRFFFILAPSKVTVYPEFVGFESDSIPCGQSRYSMLAESLALHPLKSFVRLDEVFKAAKKRQALLFDRTASDWNGLGAMVAAETFHRQAFAGELNLPLLDYVSSDDRRPGDLKNRLLGLASDVEQRPFQHLGGSQRPGFLSGIVYGDSFLRNLTPYLVQMFAQLDVVRADRIPSIKHNEDWSAYDMILIETSEVRPQNLRIDLDGIYAMLEDNADIPVRIPLDLGKVLPVSQSSLELTPAGLQIKSLGSQSAFELKSLPASDESVFNVLKISMETPQPELMTIMYLSGAQYLAQKPLKAGLTTVYLPLPYQKSTSLRFYPGTRTGMFVLRSAEILGFSKQPEIEEPLEESVSVAMAPIEDRFISMNVNPDSSVSDSPIDTGMPEGLPDAVLHSIGLHEIASQNAYMIETRANAKRESVGENEISDTDVKNPVNDAISGPGSLNDAQPPISTESSITVADFEDGRIFQRRGNSINIVVSGTYSAVHGGVEARVISAGSSEEIVPWTLIDETPKNGIFMGMIPHVPQGGWYNLQVRDNKKHANTSRGNNRWGVGMLVACLGQSNMKEWFYTGDRLKGHPLLRKYSAGGWAELGDKGHGAIAFGNRIIERLGIPVGLLDFSKNGSGLNKEADWGTGYWEDTAPGSIYNRLVSGVAEAGGFLEFVLWIQGEADAARGSVTEQEYRSSLESFVTHQIRSDLENGSQREYLPFLVVTMVKRPGGKDEPHQAIRNAQKHVAENLAECYLAATTLDLKNQGKQHLHPDAYITMGRRVSQAVLYVLGEETYYRGPSVSEVKPLDNKTIDIRIKHSGGSDFSPPSGITGWEVRENGNRVPIEKIYRHDAQTIRIVLKHHIDGNAEIRYLYGAMPDTTHPVIDNSEMSLPLEEFHSGIQLEK